MAFDRALCETKQIAHRRLHQPMKLLLLQMYGRILLMNVYSILEESGTTLTQNSLQQSFYMIQKAFHDHTTPTFSKLAGYTFCKKWRLFSQGKESYNHRKFYHYWFITEYVRWIAPVDWKQCVNSWVQLERKTTLIRIDNVFHHYINPYFFQEIETPFLLKHNSFFFYKVDGVIWWWYNSSLQMYGKIHLLNGSSMLAVTCTLLSHVRLKDLLYKDFFHDCMNPSSFWKMKACSFHKDWRICFL